MTYHSRPDVRLDELLKDIDASTKELEKLSKTCPKVFAKYHKQFAIAFISAKNNGKLPDGTVLTKAPSDEVAKQIALSSLPDDLVEEYYLAKVSLDLSVEVARNLRRTLDALKKGNNEADANDWSSIS